MRDHTQDQRIVLKNLSSSDPRLQLEYTLSSRIQSFFPAHPGAAALYKYCSAQLDRMANSALMRTGPTHSGHLLRISLSVQSGDSHDSHARLTNQHNEPGVGTQRTILATRSRPPKRSRILEMTHTTGLGIGWAASRHRAVIGGGGAERQERDSRRSLGAALRGSGFRGVWEFGSSSPILGR